MQITPNFTLAELTATNTGQKNNPGTSEVSALTQLCINVLQPLRDMYGKPVTITSGYRSMIVNRIVGGSSVSQHLLGEASDLSCADNAKLFNLIRKHLVFDQLIWEKGNDVQPDWVHVSYRKGANRRQVLKFKSGKYISM